MDIHQEAVIGHADPHAVYAVLTDGATFAACAAALLPAYG